jgi:hypothetical protein
MRAKLIILGDKALLEHVNGMTIKIFPINSAFQGRIKSYCQAKMITIVNTDNFPFL